MTHRGAAVCPLFDGEVGRIFYVRYRNVSPSDLDEWGKPGYAAVVWPPESKSGDLVYPYRSGQ
jgi:hypothetical protein